MKKIIDWFFGVLIACSIIGLIQPYTFADGDYYYGSSQPSGGECAFASGYDFGYNGDQASGDTYGCLSGSPLNGTESAGGIVTANGRTGNGVEVNAPNEYLQFTTTQDWSSAHIPIDVKLASVTGGAIATVFETYYDGSNQLFIYFIDGVLYYRWTGNGTHVTGNHNVAITANTWVTFELDTDTTNSFSGSSGIRVRIDLNGDGDFDDANEGYSYESDTDGVTAMSNNPTYFNYGENNSGQNNNTNTFIDNGFVSW